MQFWYQIPEAKFVTIDYGRYEAVRQDNTRDINDSFTWEPVLAGPPSLCEHLVWMQTAD